MEHCPLCGNSNGEFFFKDKFRTYLQCPACSLLFVPAEYIPSVKEEKERYLQHNNSIDDSAYVAFLSKSIIPLVSLSDSNSKILDYGSGPNPVLADYMSSMGLYIDKFDPYFHNDTTVLSRNYDAVVSTEVFEHIQNLAAVLEKIWSMLNKKGWLIIQTSPYPEAKAFRGWNYKNDSTHIRFFSSETFVWIKQNLNAQLSFPEPSVAVFHKI